MTYVQLLDEGVRVNRKPHRCFDCYKIIPKGSPHKFQSCAYEGRAYTIRQHVDCAEASEFYRKFHGLRDWDFDIDGIPPLADMISDAGEHESDFSMLRGRFPHVTCRIEFRYQT